MDNPFQVLDLPPAYALDPADLERRYLAASARHHPDRYTDPLDQADAADRMAQVTQAYRVLKDPEQRANALLSLLGGPAKEDDTSLPPDLLMEMMEVREELEAAVEKDDAAELDRLRNWARDRRSAHEQTVASKLTQHATPAELKAARLELNAMRYMNRMLDQMPDPT